MRVSRPERGGEGPSEDRTASGKATCARLVVGGEGGATRGCGILCVCVCVCVCEGPGLRIQTLWGRRMHSPCLITSHDVFLKAGGGQGRTVPSLGYLSETWFCVSAL